MTVSSKSYSLLLAAVSISLGLGAGCGKPPATRTQDVLDYIRNARDGAAVRRLNPEAQAYVDAVMKAYGAYQKALKPVANLTDRKALWPKDSAKWRDVEKVKKLRDALVKWQEDKADDKDMKVAATGADDDKPKTRPELLAAIGKAVAKFPSMPDATSATQKKAVDDITLRLRTTRPESAYAELASQYIALLSLVVDHADAFTKGEPGLVLDDAAVTGQADSAWQAIHDTVKDWTDIDADKAARILAEEDGLRKKALEQKQALRSAISTDPEKMRQYRRLDVLFEYYDTRIKWAENLEKKLKAEAQAEAEKAKQSAASEETATLKP